MVNLLHHSLRQPDNCISQNDHGNGNMIPVLANPILVNVHALSIIADRVLQPVRAAQSARQSANKWPLPCPRYAATALELGTEPGYGVLPFSDTPPPLPWNAMLRGTTARYDSIAFSFRGFSGPFPPSGRRRAATAGLHARSSRLPRVPRCAALIASFP